MERDRIANLVTPLTCALGQRLFLLESLSVRFPHCEDSMRDGQGGPTAATCLIVAVIGVVVVLGCATGPSRTPVAVEASANTTFSITVASPVVTFTRQATFAWVDVVATITNHADRRLYGDDCLVAAQREIDGKWVTVWTETCLVQHLTSIAPGDSVVRTIRIKGSFAADDPLKADARLTAGTYRLTFPLSYKTVDTIRGSFLDEWPSDDARSTSPFQIRDP